MRKQINIILCATADVFRPIYDEPTSGRVACAEENEVKHPPEGKHCSKNLNKLSIKRFLRNRSGYSSYCGGKSRTKQALHSTNNSNVRKKVRVTHEIAAASIGLFKPKLLVKKYEQVGVL